mmetsp:Transcript_143215/g.399242  ORF Transcript_143215/g.399242 Transcript_143215/m.399242 type:complete len:295 (-) Transcript_143215:567-1451(-)
MEGAILLLEGGAGRDCDQGVLQEFQAVEQVGRLAQLLRCSHGSCRHLDPWEGVHGPIHWLARDARDGIEGLAHRVGAACEGILQCGTLQSVGLVGSVTRPRRVHIAAHCNHAGDGWTQVDAHKLVQVAPHGLVHVVEVQVAPADATLACRALRGGVETHELLVLCVRRAHLAEHLVAGREGDFPVHVLLVDLVSEQQQAVRIRKAHQVLQLLRAEALARGVARVDENNGSHLDPLGPGSLQRLAQAVHAEPPARLFVQVVAHELAAVEGDGGRIQRVLRQGHQHPVLLVTNHGL